MGSIHLFRYSLAATLLLCCFSAFSQTDTLKRSRVRIGYAESDETVMSGKADMVTEEKMNKGLVKNSLDALSGRSAGVSITKGNSAAMLNTVRVRGTTSLTGGNDPLVIIDGVSSDLATLNTIYPADIESFTILKDASETAQYGSRGASGVIEVQTKKGNGGVFRISYDGTFGFESAYKFLPMLDGKGYRRAAAAQGISILDRGYDTNFQKEISRTGTVQNHHIAFGGGSETASYRASVGMMDHRTVIRTNNYHTYIAKLDISQKAFDNHLTVDLGVFGSLQKNNQLPFMQKLIYSAQTFNPTFPEEANADGRYDQVTEAIWINNPNSLLRMKQDEDNGHFNIHMSATVQLMENLRMKAFGSYSYSTENNAHYYPTFV